MMEDVDDHSRLLSWFGWDYNFTVDIGNTTIVFDDFGDFKNATKELHSQLQPATDVDIEGVKAAIYFNLFVFLSAAILYECLRMSLPAVYASRQRNIAHATQDDEAEDNPQELPDIYENKVPFHWISPILGVSWRRIREVAGLDAYFYLRYIRMCYRITSVTALWGMVVLFPTFSTGNNGADGWYSFSMANVIQGNTWRIWVPSIFMYVFSAFVFYIMKNELGHFMELRLDFLGKAAERGVNPQHHYSIMIENIPKELRCDRALHEYFNKLFPGKVHSANVLLKLPDLEALCVRRRRTVKRLERSIATYEATKTRPTHIMGRPRVNCCDIELSPLECLRYERAKFHDIRHDGEVTRGQLVDSIDYYIHDLQTSNKNIFLLQKEKMAIADDGNRSMTVNDWFNKVSRIADMFIDEDDDYDYSYEESEGIRSKSESWAQDIDSPNSSTEIAGTWSSEGIHLSHSEDQSGYDKTKQIPTMAHREISDQTLELNASRSDGGTQWTKPEKAVRTSNGKSLYYEDSKYRSNHEEPQNMDRGIELKTRNESALITSPLSSGLSLNPTQSDLKRSEVKKRMKRVKFSADDPEMQNKKEPLINGSVTYEDSILSNNKKVGTPSQSTKIVKKRRVVSRIGGRLGLDFLMYVVKRFNRTIMKQLDENKEETKLMCSTGFVTFYDLASTTFAVGVPLNHTPHSLDVKVAPEARDLQWDCAHLPKAKNKRREAWTNSLLLLGAVFWSVPIAIIQTFASAQKIAQIPGCGWILYWDNGALVPLIDAYLPVVMLLTLIFMLSMVLEEIATSFERRKTKSGIDECVVHRYFYYQLANIYVTVTAGSLWKSLAEIVDHPHQVFEILGNSLPTMVGYFNALLITKIFGGLPSIMLRISALGRYLVLRILHKEKYLTQRDLNQVYRQEPVWYGWEYPNQLMVIVICFTYACISPVILIFGSVFFFMSLVVYKKQVLYVYTPAYESGGTLFPQVIEHTIVGLMCGQITFISYCRIRGGFLQPIAMIPLLYMSFWIKSYFNTKYSIPSKKLTLERAFELDEKIGTFKYSKSKGVVRDLPSRRGKVPPQVHFSSNYYKQPVLTEPPGEPLPYRSGYDDPMTKEARGRLSQNRIHMWSAERRMTLD